MVTGNLCIVYVPMLMGTGRHGENQLVVLKWLKTTSTFWYVNWSLNAC
jgi:hypothetical protein